MKDFRLRGANSGAETKPVMQSLYVDLVAEGDVGPTPIHLGFRSGVTFLKHYLGSLRDHDINHVALNLWFNQTDIEYTMKRLADEVFSEFPTEKSI